MWLFLLFQNVNIIMISDRRRFQPHVAELKEMCCYLKAWGSSTTDTCFEADLEQPYHETKICILCDTREPNWFDLWLLNRKCEMDVCYKRGPDSPGHQMYLTFIEPLSFLLSDNFKCFCVYIRRYVLTFYSSSKIIQAFKSTFANQTKELTVHEGQRVRVDRKGKLKSSQRKLPQSSRQSSWGLSWQEGSNAERETDGPKESLSFQVGGRFTGYERKSCRGSCVTLILTWINVSFQSLNSSESVNITKQEEFMCKFSSNSTDMIIWKE